MMKIALTGATGHIGCNLVPLLLEKGYQVRILYRDSAKLAVFKGLKLETVKADVLDPEGLKQAFQGMEAVIHLAGMISIKGDPAGMVMKTNVEGTQNVVTACLRNSIRTCIHFSSVHAFRYDRNTPRVSEASPYADHRNFLYDQSKAQGELAIREGINKGLNAYILNPTAVIGPNDYFQSYTGAFFSGLFTGQLPALVKGGFDWVDVRDLAAAVLHILENGAPDRRYLLSGHFATFRELSELSERVSGVRTPRLELPIEIAMTGLPFVRLWAHLQGLPPLYTYESLMIIRNASKCYDAGKAKREIGYSVRPLADSIRDLFNWWCSSGSKLP